MFLFEKHVPPTSAVVSSGVILCPSTGAAIMEVTSNTILRTVVLVIFITVYQKYEDKHDGRRKEEKQTDRYTQDSAKFQILLTTVTGLSMETVVVKYVGNEGNTEQNFSLYTSTNE